MAIVVEHVSRQGQIIQSQSFEKNQVVVGRSYACDMVLNDPHVDAQHLRIDFDPVTHYFSCQDLNSVNGSFIYSSNKKRSKRACSGRQPFFSGQNFQIGRTYLNIYSSEHRVAPAMRISRWESVQQILSHWWLYSILVLAFVTLSVADNYFSVPDRDKLLQYVLNTSYAILGAVCYAAFWSFIGKSVKHDPKFAVHFSLAMAVLLGIKSVDFILPFLSFNLQLGGFAPWLSYLCSASLVFIGGYVTLVSACQFKEGTRILMAAVVPLVLGIPLLSSVFNSPDFKIRPPYDKTLAAPAWQFRPVVDSAEFVNDSKLLYAQSLERMRKDIEQQQKDENR